MHIKPRNEQTALVTGGGSGIGRAFARELLEMGYGHVIIASRRVDVLAETASALSSDHPSKTISYFPFDIRDQQQTTALVEFATKRTGSVDVLINNSGLAVPEVVEAITDDGWNTVLETNLRGAMWLTRMLLPKMAAQNFGDIINVSSQAGKNGYADVPSYCASKYGLLGFADSVRDDVCKRQLNIRVVNLCPALVDIDSDKDSPSKPGFLHVRNMATTLRFVLSVDRNVVLHDIGLSGR